ncbi:DUF4328 domain-containing protein [Rhodococcus sp. HNM0563]|uniref:DUF4328 domain-containing protein n=1 Tax=Rhodococcus sp. HNM0563 TaxID=2716339 RepID=UPI00146F2362|nr:DUF4328 domain-containing protein [Rhodococcus sp. HNM0563]NLU63815.1 DUF4328 domain-containing protein [Rhodococcus sp. HNM0563]
MAAYQICVRCESRWPVSYQARQWCPSCRGLLLSPVDTHVAVPPNRRNFRWVVRSPQSSSAERTAPRAAQPTATPAYDEIPRWGLLDRPRPHAEEPTRAETLAGLAPTLLVGTAVVFGLAAVAELARYVLLLVNRTRLIEPIVLALSDSAVWATQIVGPLVALAAAVASGLRLIEVRRRVFAEHDTSDPRSPGSLLFGVVVPGVNLALPGVFLTEIAYDRPRLLRAVRIWWVLIVSNAVLFVFVLFWRQRDSLQARADAVLLTAVVAGLAAVVALATLYVLRLCDGADLQGRPLQQRRFTTATGPVYAPIAEIVPASAVREDEHRIPAVTP